MNARVLIAVTHLLGAGHLTRAAAVGRGLVRAGQRVTLVSGGMPAGLVSAAGLTLVQLPPVRVAGTDFRTLLDEEGRPAGDERLAVRRRLLLDCLDATAPDIVVTELFPFGRRILAEEHLALLDAARTMAPRPLVAASIRDILAPPSRPERAAETHDRLASRYDLVLFHGDADLVPLDASWPLDERLRPLVRETGYVDEGAAVAPAPRRRGIVVSGGSSAAALPLLEAAVAAARAVSGEPWIVLAGAGVAAADLARLAAAAPAHVTVERARPDFRDLLASAAVSVSQAGYNTAVDLLRTGPAAVLVPFEDGGETEQRLRADRLAAAGFARVLPAADLTPQTLAAAVAEAGAAPPPTGRPPRLDGADRSATFLLDALSRRKDRPGRTGGPASEARKAPSRTRAEGRETSDRPHPAPSPDWTPLRDAFARARAAGREPSLWWRDDDAGADTPALRRLIALSRDSGCPLAVAAVPRRTDASLKPLLAEAGATALVHGLSHANHAPAGEKKAEFGPHRPLAAMADEAAAALAEAQIALDGVLLPVFVPPWNRIAPELAANLPALGFAGLSAFGERPALPGVAAVNAHLDPIDWHGGRGLRDLGGLVAAAAALVARQTAGAHEPGNAIGFLTHHLVQDEAVWRFCASFLGEWRRLSGRFDLAKDLFCVGQADRWGAVGR